MKRLCRNLGARLLLAATIAVLVSSCKSSSPAVLLKVQGLTADIQRLRVSVSLDGKPAKLIDDFVGDGSVLSTLGFDLPADASGTLDVQVQGIPDYKFVIAEGKTQLSIGSGGLVEGTVELKRVEICSADHWCWERPLPAGRPIKGFWGASPNDVWAISSLGALFHFDGQVWTYVDTGYTNKATGVRFESDLIAIHGTGPSDIWAVGERGTVLHYDGRTWQHVVLPILTTQMNHSVRFSSVWAGGADNVWIMGSEQDLRSTAEYGTFFVLQRIADGWKVYDQAALGFTRGGFTTRIWGAGKTVYALGWYYSSTSYGAAFASFDGTTWTNLTANLTGLPSDAVCYDMGGSSESDIWVLCGGKLLRGDGRSMTELPNVPKAAWQRIWVKDSGEAWLAGGTASNGVARFSSGSWTSVSVNDVAAGANVPPSVPLISIWGDGAGSVWLGGHYGLIRQYRQEKWTHHLPQDLEQIGHTIKAVSGTGPQDVWAVTYDSAAVKFGSILHFDGLSWSTNYKLTQANAEVSDIWALGPRDVWMVTFKGAALQYDGDKWNARPTGSGHWQSVWGTDSNNVWACGLADGVGNRIIRWDGTSWNPQVIPTSAANSLLNRIFGSDKDHVWAIGGVDSATPSWSFLALENGAWVDKTEQIYTDGAIVRSQRPPSYLWAGGPSDIWISGLNVGSGGIYFNGIKWTHLSWVEAGPIWGVGADDLLELGRYDLMTRFSRSNPPPQALIPIDRFAGAAQTAGNETLDIWGTSAGELWSVGVGGTILHRKQP